MTGRPQCVELKYSGVEWLDFIPKHWSVCRSKRMFAVRSESAKPSDRMLTASQKYGILFQEDFIRIEGRRVVEVIMGKESLKHVEPDDFVISMRSFQGGLEWSRLEGSASFHYVMVRPIKNVWPPFFAYLFKSAPYIHALRRTSDLIRDGQELRYSNFILVDLPVVEIVEQKAIASYLDAETARIDALVTKKTTFINRLREKRQALITHAVTKGLDAAVPMKESGVEWLGRVPAHWAVRRFKDSTVSCRNGLWGADPNGCDDIECVRVADFDRDTLSVAPAIPTIRAVRKKDRDGRILVRGNLLLEKSGGGEKRPVGQVVVYNRDAPAICSNFIAKIELADGMDPWYWSYQHHAAYCCRLNTRSVKQTSGIQNLDQHQYLNELAAFPPHDEQQAISSYLNRATARIDDLIAKTELSVELLHEHRTALITAAVTGKIDLRKVA